MDRHVSKQGNVYPSHVKIPQPNGINLPIRTHELEDTVKMLGFYHSIDAPKSNHVKEMIKKGVDWVDRSINKENPKERCLDDLFLLSCSQE